MSESKSRKKKYLNPYLGGVLLGIVLLAANFVSGRGLGASGAIKSGVVTVVTTVNPSAAEKSTFIKEYLGAHGGSPMKNWLVFEMMGVLVGGFVSGALAGRLKLKVEHSPKITSNKRLFLALIGGILFGFRQPAGTRMHQWIGIEWYGRAFTGRFCDHDGHLWHSLCAGLFLQKKLDLIFK